MTMPANMSANLNGVSAFSVRQGLYESPELKTNQENESPRTHSAATNSLRPQSTSNHRTPLSTVASAHKVMNEQPFTSHHIDEGPPESNLKRGNALDDINKLYKNNDSSGNLSQSEQYDDIPENMYKPGKEDREGWIHREKLAKIENEELQAAGINLAKARSKSRDALGGRPRGNSRDRLRDFSHNDDKRAKTDIPAKEQHDNEGGEKANWDLRTPEEIANDPTGLSYSTPVLRKHGSKIPVMTTSSTPISSDRYERETPMPRKRTMSGSITPEDTLHVAKTRHIAPETDVSLSESKPSSPTKARSKSVTTPKPGATPDPKSAPGARKTSAPVKPTPASPPRPTTRGNDTERPRTAASRPEGDPPWLATMYKPDPMLPPDQQLIPTLARKRQQELWEMNGEVPSTYDREFSPLALYDADGVVKQIAPAQDDAPTERGRPHSEQTEQPEQPEQSEQAEQPESWPLKKIPTSKSPPPTNRPTTSSGTGNYSTMPKVSSPPLSLSASPRPGPMGSPSIGAPQSPSLGSGQVQGAPVAKGRDLNRQQHATDLEEEKLQKKGCCCIVM